jgi:hypothetical protein
MVFFVMLGGFLLGIYSFAACHTAKTSSLYEREGIVRQEFVDSISAECFQETLLERCLVAVEATLPQRSFECFVKFPQLRDGHSTEPMSGITTRCTIKYISLPMVEMRLDCHGIGGGIWHKLHANFTLPSLLLDGFLSVPSSDE